MQEALAETPTPKYKIKTNSEGKLKLTRFLNAKTRETALLYQGMSIENNPLTWQHPADKFEGLLRVYRQAFWTTVLVHGRDHIKKVHVYSLLGLSTHKNVNATQL